MQMHKHVYRTADSEHCFNFSGLIRAQGCTCEERGAKGVLTFFFFHEQCLNIHLYVVIFVTLGLLLLPLNFDPYLGCYSSLLQILWFQQRECACVWLFLVFCLMLEVKNNFAFNSKYLAGSHRKIWRPAHQYLLNYLLKKAARRR